MALSSRKGGLMNNQHIEILGSTIDQSRLKEIMMVPTGADDVSIVRLVLVII